jgi:hypothetical protein
MRGLTDFYTPPELLLGDQQKVLVERIGWYGHFDPFLPPR